MLHTLTLPLPKNVMAFGSDRIGGHSVGAYQGFNLGTHVGDDVNVVSRHRESFPHATQWRWLPQVHSNIALPIEPDTIVTSPADAAYSRDKQCGCVVMTADCLPLLVWQNDGTEVAAIHAGWRGLADGVIQNTLKYFTSPSKELNVWLGPCISQSNFEVGSDVVDAFEPQYHQFFSSCGNNKYLFDLQAAAHKIVNDAGIHSVYRDRRCTFTNASIFFSYRRDGVTGRQAFGIIKLS